jgi:hypothetical protein
VNGRLKSEVGQDAQNAVGFCAGGTKPPKVLCGWAYVKDSGSVVCAMGKKKPSRRELARRKKIRKFWADPGHCKAQSGRQNQFWADHPERRDAQSERMTLLMSDRSLREARSRSTKRAMRSRKRRKAHSKIMQKLKADPKFEELRMAGIKKAEADPERKARRAATLAKTLAVPAVKKRRLRSVRKATSSRAYREKMSANKQKFWDDLRARLADPKGTAKARNRGGRPRMDETYKSGALLRELGESWREITRQLDPDYAKEPEAAMHRMRVGVQRYLRSQNAGDQSK